MMISIRSKDAGSNINKALGKPQCVKISIITYVISIQSKFVMLHTVKKKRSKKKRKPKFQ